MSAKGKRHTAQFHPLGENGKASAVELSLAIRGLTNDLLQACTEVDGRTAKGRAMLAAVWSELNWIHYRVRAGEKP